MAAATPSKLSDICIKIYATVISWRFEVRRWEGDRSEQEPHEFRVQVELQRGVRTMHAVWGYMTKVELVISRHIPYPLRWNSNVALRRVASRWNRPSPRSATLLIGDYRLYCHRSAAGFFKITTVSRSLSKELSQMHGVTLRDRRNNSASSILYFYSTEKRSQHGRPKTSTEPRVRKRRSSSAPNRRHTILIPGSMSPYAWCNRLSVTYCVNVNVPKCRCIENVIDTLQVKRIGSAWIFVWPAPKY